MQPLPGDLILVRGRHWYSRIIEWWTRSPYSHVAVYVGNAAVVEALFAGVRCTSADQYAGQDLWVRPAITADERRAVAVAALSQVGKPYGWGDVLYQVRLDPRSVNRDCSTLAAWCYQQAGIPLTRLPYPTPADLAASESLAPVGQLKME